jgi:hypothetical protein
LLDKLFDLKYIFEFTLRIEMKKIIIYVFCCFTLCLSGCKSIADGMVGGFVLLSIIIGLPLMISLFLGNTISSIKNKGKYNSIDGNPTENLIGLIVLLLFAFGLIRGCIFNT